MSRHDTDGYRDGWGTPPEVVDVVRRIHGGGNVVDVTNPPAPGLQFLDLGLNFDAPACGFGGAGVVAAELAERARSGLTIFCNPPGDRRGKRVRHTIQWAARVFERTRIPITVAVFNESALYDAAVCPEHFVTDGRRRVAVAVAGIFRKRVRWLNPETGEPGASPPHHGALLTFASTLSHAEYSMHSLGMLTFNVQITEPKT